MKLAAFTSIALAMQTRYPFQRLLCWIACLMVMFCATCRDMITSIGYVVVHDATPVSAPLKRVLSVYCFSVWKVLKYTPIAKVSLAVVL